MIPCPACHRHLRAEESVCPFCANTLAVVPIPSASKITSVALMAGLSLLACTDSGESDDPIEIQESGADYGGPPPCEWLDQGDTLVLGSNPVDTGNFSEWNSTCGDLDGTGPDRLFQFTSPTAGNYKFSLVDPSFEGWLLTFSTSDDYNCGPNSSSECAPMQDLNIELGEGSVLYLTLDGTAGGTATIEVTQE